MSFLHVLLNFNNKISDKFLHLPDEVINVAVTRREKWLKQKANRIKKGSLVLDAGAGQCPYKKLFSHCKYKSQDFVQYSGTKIGVQREKWKYGEIDYVCDILEIPVPDKTFHVVICTEVLEHVPFPVETIASLARVLKKGGTLLLTAPLASGLHQEPYHFYGGFTPHFYRKVFETYGLRLDEITPEGGLLAHTAQEIFRSSQVLAKSQRWGLIKRYLFGKLLPTYFYSLDSSYPVKEFTIGYMIQATKI